MEKEIFDFLKNYFENIYFDNKEYFISNNEIKCKENIRDYQKNTIFIDTKIENYNKIKSITNVIYLQHDFLYIDRIEPIGEIAIFGYKDKQLCIVGYYNIQDNVLSIGQPASMNIDLYKTLLLNINNLIPLNFYFAIGNHFFKVVNIEHIQHNIEQEQEQKIRKIIEEYVKENKKLLQEIKTLKMKMKEVVNENVKETIKKLLYKNILKYSYINNVFYLTKKIKIDIKGVRKYKKIYTLKEKREFSALMTIYYKLYDNKIIIKSVVFDKPFPHSGDSICFGESNKIIYETLYENIEQAVDVVMEKLKNFEYLNLDSMGSKEQFEWLYDVMDEIDNNKFNLIKEEVEEWTV